LLHFKVFPNSSLISSICVLVYITLSYWSEKCYREGKEAKTTGLYCIPILKPTICTCFSNYLFL